MEETIDLKDYFNIIKRNSKKIIGITLATGIVGSGLAFLPKQEVVIEEKLDYDVNTRIIVEENCQKSLEYLNNITDSSNIKETVNKALSDSNLVAKSHSIMIDSYKVLEEVIKNLNLNMSVQEFRREFNLLIWPIEDTNIIEIYVRNEQKDIIDDIANEIVKVYKNQNPEVNISVVQEAIEPTIPALLLDKNGKPLPKEEQPQVVENEEAVESQGVSIKKVVMNGVIGIVLGGMIALFVVFMKEYMDNKLRTQKQVSEVLGLEILGVVPKEGEK